MQLSNEDNLRLNVLLRQDVKAIRLDDSRLCVHALTERGEAKVVLNPTCREEKYLRLVRELFSTHVLGSPGGYPVYIRRWTRMGQTRDTSSLQKLLLLGEPEAVTAVVHAPELTPEIAQYAWWAYPTSENARQLLAKPVVAESSLGPELAEFILEFLPFEEAPQAMIDSVKLILQPGLISTSQRDALWKRGRRKQTYYIGFLHSTPDELPENSIAASGYQDTAEMLEPLLPVNPIAAALLRSYSPQGQLFLKTSANVLDKIGSQEASVELADAIAAYYSAIRPDQLRYRSVEEIHERIATERENNPHFKRCLAEYSQFQPHFEAMLFLSMIGEFLLAPILGKTDAIGSVMRKRLAPATDPILSALRQLNSGIKV
ncbi:MAG: hypothetical protein ACWA44_01810 [Thiotrichales bacterium]